MHDEKIGGKKKQHFNLHDDAITAIWMENSHLLGSNLLAQIAVVFGLICMCGEE